MAPEVSFELEGMSELVSRLEQWGADAVGAAEEAMTLAASDAADLARATVPVDTGALRDSITSRSLEPFVVVVEAGGPSAPHVRPVEEDTGFFNRAVDEVEGRFARTYRRRDS